VGASHPTEPRAERHSHLGSLANLKPDERTHVPVLDPSHDRIEMLGPGKNARNNDAQRSVKKAFSNKHRRRNERDHRCGERHPA